nr:MAG: hypothetical protein DIU56_04740 [Pseudomonadota bacterium]
MLTHDAEEAGPVSGDGAAVLAGTGSRMHRMRKHAADRPQGAALRHEAADSTQLSRPIVRVK